jgi:hypothetical protein
MAAQSPAPETGPARDGSPAPDHTSGWPPQPTAGNPAEGPARTGAAASTATASMSGTWVAGLVLVGLGGYLLIARWIPDAGQYIVLAIGLILLIVFFATGEYGFLVPGGIVSGIGAGIPLSIAYAGQLGGGLFLISMGVGFLLIWVLALLFRVHERNPWPLVPGLVLGTVGAALASGERGRGVADAIATGWPIVLVVAGLLLLVGSFRRRAS